MTNEQWLQERRKRICSSDIAAVINADPYRTPLNIALSKLTNEDIFENDYTLVGHALESFVMRWFADENDIVFWEDKTAEGAVISDKIIYAPYPKFIIHPQNDNFAATPDYFYGGDGILECKTTMKIIDSVQEYPPWYIQCQWQLFVTGRKEATLAWVTLPYNFSHKKFLESYKEEQDIEVLRSVFKYNQETFQRDEEVIDSLQFEATKFLEDYISQNKLPEATTEADAAYLYPSSILGKVIDVKVETNDLCEEILNMDAEAKELEEKIKIKKGILKTIIKDAEAINYDGKCIATYKTAVRHSIDTNKLKADYANIAQEITVTNEYRRLYIKKKSKVDL